MKASELLMRAQERISTEATWTQHRAERVSNGVIQYCAIGALFNVHEDAERLYETYLRVAANEWLTAHGYAGAGWNILYINDQIGHAAVMEVYAAAIEMALEDEMKEQECHSDASSASISGSGMASDPVPVLAG